MTNQTLEAGIENTFTKALVREFNLDSRLPVVQEKRADSILRGSIQNFTISSVSYDASGLALEYRAEVSMGLTLQRLDTGDLIRGYAACILSVRSEAAVESDAERVFDGKP